MGLQASDGNEKRKKEMKEMDANDVKEKEMAEKEWREGSICHWGRVEWSDNARRKRRRMGYAATLTLNHDLARCHKYVQADGRRRVAGSFFAFFRPRNRRSFGKMCSLDRVPKCDALTGNILTTNAEQGPRGKNGSPSICLLVKMMLFHPLTNAPF